MVHLDDTKLSIGKRGTISTIGPERNSRQAKTTDITADAMTSVLANYY